MSPPPRNLAAYSYGVPPGFWGGKAGAAVFDLCRFQSYISVKDQIIRARTLADWLRSLDVLGKEVPRVLVIGGGVAGVTTAALLAEYGRANGVKVMLAEKAKVPPNGSAVDALFTLQAACTSRVVSLTQYDWPALHWHTHEFPSASSLYPPHGKTTGGSFQLTIPPQPERADLLAQQWRQDFAKWHKRNPGLRLLVDTTAVVPFTLPSSGPIEVAMKTDGSPGWLEEFDLVVYAVGFGTEQIPTTSAGRVTRYFWETDTFTATPNAHAGERFAIVGMGDGGLQDFIRLCCRTDLQCAAEVIEAIRMRWLALTVARTVRQTVVPLESRIRVRGAMTLPPSLDVWTAIERQLTDLDRQATLTRPWEVATRAAEWLQADVEKVVDRLAAYDTAALEAAVDSVLRSQPLKSITIVASTAYPTKCYMLNHFLFVLLRWRLLQRNGAGAPTFQHRSTQASDPSSTPAGFTIPELPNDSFDQLVWRVGTGQPPPKTMIEGLRMAVGRNAQPFYPPDRFSV